MSNRVEDKPKAIFPHTLFQEHLTIWAGLGEMAVLLTANTKDIQVGSSQLGEVSQLLDDSLLGMNRIV